jgi:SAM-dependent methyltransferase
MSTLPNFDPLARPYALLEALTFGPLLHQVRCQFLPQLTSSRLALILGDGDGRFTAALLRINPQIQVTALDLSPAMLAELRSRCLFAADRLNTQLADLRQPLPPAILASSYDLIATHFVLDCLSQPETESLIAALAPNLAPDGQWILSDFTLPPRTNPARLAAKTLIAALYLAFRLLTGLQTRQIPDHTAAFRHHHLTLQSEKKRLFGILHSQQWIIGRIG